ncbi:hypothetical protein JRG19_02520 [Pseudoclavibacter alba]|uniref:phage terminase small subunit n=1 Tax=Pseudoclavibacter albus TaxID=272241 RepID=UPI0019D128E8|nr:hypothetical protein [Pseudoclavibacter alba]MBN6777424.1 hypothetical protein [Pseudoclavibacter alba]
MTRAPGAHVVKPPAASSEWHPIAKRLWKAAKESGQSRFYEPSDWAVLYSLMDDLTYYKQARVRSGQMLQTIMSSLSSLLLTEGDRRRLQIELAKPVEAEASSVGEAEVLHWQRELRAVN